MNIPQEQDSTLNDSAASSAEQGAGTQQAGEQQPSAEPKSLDDVGEAFAAAAGAEGQEPQPEEAGSQPEAGKPEDQAAVEDGEANAEANAEGDEAGEAESGEQKTDEKDESLTDPTKPPPFHEHPRWKQVVEERDRLKPLAEQQGALLEYMQANDISAEDLRGMLEIGSLMHSNPEEAFKRLEPIYAGLGQLIGRALPSDLEKQVAEGKITPSTAAELAQMRAKAALAEQQNKRLATQQQSVTQRYIVGAVQEWSTTKQRTDLAFKPGSPMWQLVDDRFQRLTAATPPKTPQEAVALAEKAYSEIKKVMTPAKPAVKPQPTRTTGKTLSSNGSASGKKKEPTSLDEVAMQATGYRW